MNTPSPALQAAANAASASGHAIQVDGAIARARGYDLIVIPGVEGIRLSVGFAPDPRLVAWLGKQKQKGARLLALTTGVCFVAATGLADATLMSTHWAFVRLLKKRYPACRFVTHPSCVSADGIESHHAESLTIERMCREAGMAERTLKRRFQLTTQVSPNVYVQKVRIDKAKKLLLATDAPIKAIASEVGYENVSFFVRLFKTQVGQTPAQWRRAEAAATR